MYKVVIITTAHWSYKTGGAEYQAKLLVDKLSMDENVKILYLSRYLDRNYKPDCYRLERIAKYNPIQRYALFIDGYSLYKKLKEYKPDIIYQRGGSAYTGIAAYYAKMHNSIFIFHIASDNDLMLNNSVKEFIKPNKSIDRYFLRYGIKNATTIIAQTNLQKRKVKKKLHFSDVTVIPNYHSDPIRKKFKKSGCIIWVANFKTIKQPELFIKLAKELEKRDINVDCLMVGAPTQYPKGYQEQLENEIKKQKNIFYKRELAIDEVNDLIAISKLLINTSKWEGFPNTFIQAWQRETPVISLNVDPDNILEKYKCGVCSKKFKKLVEDTIHLLNNDRDRCRIANNAKIYADNHHSMKNLDILKHRIISEK
jgi:glycosyltransferase involved in cell wall biosynthesis